MNRLVSVVRPILLCLFAGQSAAGQTAPIQTSQLQTSPRQERPAVHVPQFESLVKPFIEQYCLKCHDAQSHEAERQFESLTGDITTSDQLVDFQDIVDQLNLGTMPPADETQPKAESKQKIVDVLTQAIEQYRVSAEQSPARYMRRLSAREYHNSIADLLQLNMTMFQPTAPFPKDQTAEHLDNTDHLVTSGFLLERYLDAADAIIERILTDRRQPTEQTWHFSDGFRQQPEIDQVHKYTTKYKHLTLYDVRGADKHEGAYGPIHAFREGVPHDGYYDLEFSASAVNRLHPYDDDFLQRDRNEPLQLGIVAGFSAAGPLHKPQPVEPLLAKLNLADGAQRYKVRVWMDRGCTPRFTFENGLMDARNLWSKLIRKYPDRFQAGLKGIVLYRRNAIEHGELPQIHVDDITIRGPIYEQWPTAPQIALLGPNAASILKQQKFGDRDALKSQLRQLATRVYRRPATADDIEPLVKLIDHRKSLGRSELLGFGDAAKAMFCSPSFLLLQRLGVDDRAVDSISAQHETASRLSCFLWSSCPDAELLHAATTGKLQSKVQITAQAQRMLGDAKADRFATDFLDAWLNLRSLGATPPDRGQFRDYYQFDLLPAMREETKLFFQHVLQNNLPLDHFIDSDFTFANKRLAQHYNLPFDGKNEFRRVELTDNRRGGLLGQASVLTVSANGIDTSPVVRGVWVLENLLASPPAPPPPDVEPLDPDTRGATTIREQLAKHRHIPSCNNCHRKIDPLGFALENFDATGAWRTRYDKTNQIDASGVLPDGRRYEDIVQFKSHLMADRAAFYRGLVSKLLAYAHGRPTSPLERPEIDRLTRYALKDGIGLRDVVLEIAAGLR
ncbi:MAG: DUF1592 domain-containing protein [Aureliella sp.]